MRRGRGQGRTFGGAELADFDPTLRRLRVMSRSIRPLKAKLDRLALGFRALSHWNWLLILQVTCWFFGTNQSTLKLKRSRALRIGVPK